MIRVSKNSDFLFFRKIIFGYFTNFRRVTGEDLILELNSSREFVPSSEDFKHLEVLKIGNINI